MSAGIFVGMEHYIMTGFDNVLQGVTEKASGWMGYLFSAATISLYLTWRGYQAMAGKLNRPFEDVMWDISKMLIIMIFVTNSGGYLDLTIDAINGLRDGVSGDRSIWSVLDSVWEKAQYLGETLYNRDDSTYVPAKGLLAEALVWGGVTFMAGSTALINLAAELVLKIMTATAPIFIFCLMWSWVRDMFNNWLKTILSCILTVFFSGIALQVVMNYINHILSAATNSAAEANYLTLGFQVGLAAVGAGVVIFISYKLANALAGASAQGAVQGLASAGLDVTAGKASAGAGAIGERAASNLQSGGESPAPSSSSSYSGATGSVAGNRAASIERMSKRN